MDKENTTASDEESPKPPTGALSEFRNHPSSTILAVIIAIWSTVNFIATIRSNHSNHTLVAKAEQLTAETERIIKEETIPCTAERTTEIDKAREWIRSHQQQLIAEIKEKCMASTDCKGTNWTETEFIETTQSAYIFCPPIKETETPQCTTVGNTIPLAERTSTYPGAFAIRSHNGLCLDVGIITHETLHLLDPNTIKHQPGQCSTLRDDMIYTIGDIAEDMCKKNF